MPSPILHSSVAASLARGAREPLDWSLAARSVVAANVADLDLVPGVFVGAPNRWHHAYTHSFPVALALGALFALPPWRGDSPDYRARFRYFALVCLTHPLLDLLVDDRHWRALGEPFPNIGLWWPFSSRGYDVLWPLLPTVSVEGSWTRWFGPENLRACAFDIVVGALLFAAANWLARRPSRLVLTDQDVSQMLQ